MSVEQTTQLIQLIFNSVLLIVACALVMRYLGSRHLAVEKYWKTVNRRYAALLELEPSHSNSSPAFPDHRLLQAKKSCRQVQNRYVRSCQSLLAIHYSLLLAVSSTLVMTLRALVHADWLIVTSLSLFVVAVALLLLSVGFSLLELNTADRPLWEELSGAVPAHKSDQLRPSSPWKAVKSHRRGASTSHTTSKSSVKARVS